ncbi:MAG: hypothetical protein DI534_04485 [Leifsonia xyli]|nr:MAG: hypothetical protein DI534_04485 [Leifsonia xyli]
MKLGTQVWGLITVVVVIGVLAAGWFLGVSPQLTAQAQADSQRAAAVAQNQGIETTIADLKKKKADLASYEKRSAEIEKIIPSGIDGAAFIQTINDLASSTGVVVEQISLNDVVPYTPPAAAPDAAATDGSKSDDAKTDDGAKTDSATTADAPAAATTSSGAPAPLTDSRITGANFLLVPVTVAVSGNWDQVLAFTHGIQTGDRLMLVTKVDTSGENGTFKATLSGTIYVLIRPQAPAAAGTTTGADTAGGTTAAAG